MKPTRRQIISISGSCLAVRLLSKCDSSEGLSQADVCIYGATASGVAAAMGAADAGASVVVVEPSRWLGGMSGGGLSAIDWGNKKAVGRLAMKLLVDGDDVAMRELYKRELAQRNIPIVYEHRLASVRKENGRI